VFFRCGPRAVLVLAGVRRAPAPCAGPERIPVEGVGGGDVCSSSRKAGIEALRAPGGHLGTVRLDDNRVLVAPWRACVPMFLLHKIHRRETVDGRRLPAGWVAFVRPHMVIFVNPSDVRLNPNTSEFGPT